MEKLVTDRNHATIPAQVKKIFRFSGWLFFIIGLLLCFLGVLALPDGGLMFALPYFFLIPGITLTVIGGFVVWLARIKRKPGTVPDPVISEQRLP